MYIILQHQALRIKVGPGWPVATSIAITITINITANFATGAACLCPRRGPRSCV